MFTSISVATSNSKYFGEAIYFVFVSCALEIY